MLVQIVTRLSEAVGTMVSRRHAMPHQQPRMCRASSCCISDMAIKCTISTDVIWAEGIGKDRSPISAKPWETRLRCIFGVKPGLNRMQRQTSLLRSMSDSDLNRSGMSCHVSLDPPHQVGVLWIHGRWR